MKTSENLGIRDILNIWQKDPVAFLEMIGVKLWQQQKNIINAIRDNSSVSVKSCNSAGKTYTISCAITSFLCAYPRSKVIITAPTFRQVKDVLFAELSVLMNKIKDTFIEFEDVKVNKTSINIAPDWFALGFSTNQPDKFQGFHGNDIMVVIDEASGVDVKIFQAIDSLIAGGGNKKLVKIGNPLERGGRFYDDFRLDRGLTMTISAFDTPNLVSNNIKTIEQVASMNDSELKELNKPFPFLITPEWIKEQIEYYGEDSPFVQSRILAEYPDSSINSLIPFDKLEAMLGKTLPLGDCIYGIDIAGEGDDNTVVLKRRGGQIMKIQSVNGYDASQSPDFIADILKMEHGHAYIDSAAIGYGVAQLVRERGITFLADVNAGSKSSNPKRFHNLRAQGYWNVRMAVLSGNLAIKDDEWGRKLVEELGQIMYTDHKGVLQIESKKDIKKRLGHSPDLADALMLSYVYDGGINWNPEDDNKPRSRSKEAQEILDENERMDLIDSSPDDIDWDADLQKSYDDDLPIW